MDRNEGRSRAPLAVLERELVAEWQSAAVSSKLRFAFDVESHVPTSESTGPSDPSARSTAASASQKRGRGKDSARRVA